MSQRWTKMIASPSSPYVPFHHALPRKLLKASYWIALLLVTLITFNLSGCSGSDPNLQNLTIGVMISTTGPKRLGQEAIAAINLSLQKIQESSDFALVREKGYQFQIWMDNVPCDPSNAFAEMMDIFTHKDAHQSVQNAFVGPSCDEVCQPGGRLAKYFDVMMISYGCESSIFDDKEEYPTFGRTTTTFKDMEIFFAEVIHYFRWPRVTLVTVRTPVWQETMGEFEEQISRFDVTVRRWTVDSVALIQQPEFLTALLAESRDTRVFILLMYPEAAMDFMRQSELANLTTAQAKNVFMVVDFAGSHHKMDTQAGSYSFLDGVLDITYDVQPETDGFKNFLSEILDISKITINPNCSNYEYGIHSMLVSDGIYVVAGAFNSSLAQNISVTEGAAVANTTHGSTFLGLYHMIEMDEKATRRPRFMLHNIQGGCYKPIGRTRPDGSGLEFIDRNIVWPGGGNVTPAGQPRCGWMEELCPSDNQTALVTGISIGGTVFLFLASIIIAIIIIWRRNLKSRLLATDWLLDWAVIEPRLYYPSIPGYVGVGSTRHLGGSLESLSTLRSEGSDCMAGAGPAKMDGLGGTHSAAPTTTTMSGGMLFRCPVVKMDVEGVWAIKFIRKPSLSLTQSVKKELNLVRSLKHQNVNAFMGACVKPGHMCVMWAYSPKGSLLDLIHSGIFKMDLMFQLSFAQDIIKGLAYIHKSELTCHGRLKSTNVVVDAGLTCKLTDVHMPRLREGEEDLDEDDPNYWFQHVWTAPELLREGSDVDHQRADIYSYGIVLYEIMLRRKPYVTESVSRLLIEPCWQSVIECVREPEKLTDFLENPAVSDNIPEVTETDDNEEVLGSFISGQPSLLGSDFPGARRSVSQGTPSTSDRGSKFQDQVQHISYWNSFRNHYQRNRQSFLSHRTQGRSTNSSSLKPDSTDLDRPKSTSVLLPEEPPHKITPARSLSNTPAPLTEPRRNRLYGTSRRSSCDSSLSTPAQEPIASHPEPESAKVQSPLVPHTCISSNIHQSAASQLANPLTSQTYHSSLSPTPLPSILQKKSSSPPRQRRKPRISPLPQEDNLLSTPQPATHPQNNNNSLLSGIAEDHKPHLIVTSFLTQNETALDSLSSATANTVGANKTGNVQSLHDAHNSSAHSCATNPSKTIGQPTSLTDTPSPAPDLPQEPESGLKLPVLKTSGQSPNAVSPVPGEMPGMNTSWVESVPHSDHRVITPGAAKGITSPKRTASKLGDHKLLPIHFPASPMVISVGSPEHHASCPQEKESSSPASPPSCCCCPKLKKSPSQPDCKRKTPEKIFTHDLHLDMAPSENSVNKRYDWPDSCERAISTGKSENNTDSRRVCSPSEASAHARSHVTLSSRPSTGQLHRTASAMTVKAPQLMRPEIPYWHSGSGGRAGSISTATGQPAAQGATRGRAMSVDRSKLVVNAPSGEGRASALDIFSRSSFYNRRGHGVGAGAGRARDKGSQMIELMKQCWAEEPDQRPSADAIIKKIRALTTGRSLSDNIEKIVSRYSEQLEVTVNERTRRLEEEKAKYFRVLCEVIPQKYVSALVSGNKVEAESFSNVTIFFSDIVGFTSICGRCSPQEVLDFLNELYTNFDIVLNNYKVYKVETIGDAYMVAGGIPEPTPDHAQQIAYLALHLLSVSTAVKAPYVTQDGVRTKRNLRLRIGLNSGPVVAGIVGEKMPRYCLYGNTVNIASRMESNGKALRVHMSKETTQELQAMGGFDISYRGMISVKGKDMPVPTYWLNNSFTHPFDLPDWTTPEDGD